MTTVNKAQCRLCRDVLESITRNDFKQCSCGEIFIDGGRSGYYHAGAKNWSNFIDLTGNFSYLVELTRRDSND